jgi:aminoglycoside phosphotransferase (APT) family kinase protein
LTIFGTHMRALHAIDAVNQKHIGQTRYYKCEKVFDTKAAWLSALKPSPKLLYFF